MTPPEVHDYLYQLGRHWTGRGLAMELGCWLGATSVPLLQGLVNAGYDKAFWAFDRWIANDEQISKAAKFGVTITKDQSTLDNYINNTIPIYNKVKTVKGDLPDTLQAFDKKPIEICIFDAPKSNPIFINSLRALEPYFIPNVTVLGLLDYHFWKSQKKRKRKIYYEPVKFIEQNPDTFEFLKDWPGLCSCAFFKYETPIEW